MKILVIFVQALCTRSDLVSGISLKGIRRQFNTKHETRTYQGIIISSAQSTSNDVTTDAPLSKKGFDESQKLETFVRDGKAGAIDLSYYKSYEEDTQGLRHISEGRDILRGPSEDSAKKTLLMTSNLPSALGTGIIALASRYRGTQTERETIYIMSSAQDLSSSQAADRRCLTQDGNTPKLDASFDKYVNHFNYNHDHNSCDQIEGTSGEKDDARLGRFCREMASMMKDLKKEMFVLAGHSTWIKAFLHKYLLNQYNFDEKQLKNNDMKVGNASVISVKLRITEFTDRKGKSDFECQLMPGNTRLVYRPLPDKTK